MASNGNLTKVIPIAIAVLSMAVSIWLRSEGDVAEPNLAESAPPTDTEPTPHTPPPGESSPEAQPAVVEDDVLPTETNLVSFKSNRCLDIANQSTNNGANVLINDCNGLESQKWRFEGERIVSAKSNRCLDVANQSTDNNANVQIQDCTGLESQRWVWDGERLKSVKSNRCLDIENQSTSNGANVLIYDCNGLENQKWKRDTF